MNVCRHMTDRLKELGLMKGDTETAVQAGAHAMFMPHGLGHMMGMDVHDMEGLGQTIRGIRRRDTTKSRTVRDQLPPLRTSS
jgi:Xaa-Pro aminopeptidase